MKSQVLVVATVAFWLVVGVVLLRTSMIGFHSVTLHWSHPDTPNSAFHWEQANSIHPSIVPAHTTQLVKVTVPRSFRTATLSVVYSGDVTIASIPPKDAQVKVGTSSAVGTATLVLDRADVLLSNRVFAVRVTGGSIAGQVHRMDIQLQQ